MRSILSEDDLAAVLGADQAAIYFFVDWSVYAVQGRQRFAELELSYGHETSFWIADVSSVEAPAAFMGDWLKAHDSKDVNIFLAAGSGNGPIIWLKRGAIVDAVRSAINSDCTISALKPSVSALGKIKRSIMVARQNRLCTLSESHSVRDSRVHF